MEVFKTKLPLVRAMHGIQLSDRHFRKYFMLMFVFIKARNELSIGNFMLA